MPTFREIMTKYQGTTTDFCQDTVIGDSTYGHNGICAPMVFKWIKDRRLGIFFAEDTHTEAGREELMQLKFNQNDDPTEYGSDYLSLFGISKHFSQMFQLNPQDLRNSTKDAINAVSASTGYYLFGMGAYNGNGLTAHAFGVDTFQNTFFDPNYGWAVFRPVDTMRMKRAINEWICRKYRQLGGVINVTRYI